MPNSIYSPYDMRFNNPAFSQQSGQMGSFGANQLGFTSGTGTGGVSSGLPNYNASPTPTSGQGPYGLVPGTIPIPPSTFQQTVGVAPGLGNTTQLTNNIMSELQGQLDPQALKNIQDTAARFGISSGMPGTNAIRDSLAFNKTLRDVGLDTYAVKHQGQQDYLSALQGIGGTQTPQGLAAEIAAHNAQLRAAPDPQAAAQQQLANYWAALNALRGPGGGTGQGPGPQGGTGQYNTAALGLGGAAGVGNAQGFGYGSFPTGGGGTQTQANAGTGYGGVPGGFGTMFNPETGEFQDTTPINPTGSYVGMPDISSFVSTAPNPFSQYGGYYDQSASPDFGSNMTNEDYFYNYGG